MHLGCPSPAGTKTRTARTRALDETVNRADAEHQLQTLAGDLEMAGYSAASKCLSDDLDALVVHLRYPIRHLRRWHSTDESVKAAAEFQGQCLSRSPVLVAACAHDATRGSRWPDARRCIILGAAGVSPPRAAPARRRSRTRCRLSTTSLAPRSRADSSLSTPGATPRECRSATSRFRFGR